MLSIPFVAHIPRYAIMPHSIISPNGSSTGSGVTSQRRRLAAWLLLGWVMFWLVTVIQPFCSKLAGREANAEQRTVIPMGGNTAKLGNWHREAPLDGGSCQSVSATTISASDTATSPYRPNLSFNVAPAALASLPRRAGVTIAYAPSDSPSPGTPLYLRHQRLLI